MTKSLMSHEQLFNVAKVFLIKSASPLAPPGTSRCKTVNPSELQIWSLQISSLERIPAHKCVLSFLEHHQSTQHGWRSLFA